MKSLISGGVLYGAIDQIDAIWVIPNDSHDAGVTAGKFTAQKLTSILKTFSYLAYAIDWQVHKNKNINLILFNFESFFGFKLKFSILID